MATEGENDVTQVHDLERESNRSESSTDEILVREEAPDVTSSSDDRMTPDGDGEQEAEGEIREPELQAATSGDITPTSGEESPTDAGGDTMRTSGEGWPTDAGGDNMRTSGEGWPTDAGGDAMRTSGEESPLHTPGGTPIAKHVQFEEGGADPDDPPRPIAMIQERLSQTGYDGSTDDGVESGRRAADAEPNDAEVEPVAPPVVVPASGAGSGSPAAVADDRAAKSKSKSKPTDGRNALTLSGSDGSSSGSDDVRCKWGCCCGVGWIMVGLVAAVCGVMLVVYLRQFWKATRNPNESLLLYFGIGACIFSGLMLLVGFSFWTYACIHWNESGCTGGNGQKDDQDPEMSMKVKNNLGNKVYYVNNSETDRNNGSTTPVTDETFLV